MAPALHVEVIFAVGLGVLGLMVGSFLNVVIARVPEGLSVVSPRSRCPKCGRQLRWYENVPVFSWLLLGGRCKGCRAPISVRYVMVEVLTCLLFLACLQRFGISWELLSALVLVGFLVPLTFIDLAHWILPFSLTRPGIAVGLGLSLLLGLDRFYDAAIGAAVGFGSFWLLEIVGEKVFKKEALGGGDKYLLALIGAFMTWRVLLGVIFLSSLQGALVGSLLLLVRGRAGPAPAPAEESAPSKPDPAAAEAAQGEEDEEDDWEPGPTNLPFGPWLAIAALELLFLGEWLAAVLPRTLGWIATGRLELP